jgi:hypothetical protein
MSESKLYGATMGKTTKSKVEGKFEVNITHTNEGQFQSELNWLDVLVGGNKSLINPFAHEVGWKNITFGLGEYNIKLNVVFGDDSFPATLTSIKVNRKYKDGTDTFKYVWSLLVDTATVNSICEYYGTKEMNEDGKEVPVIYDFVMKKAVTE